VIRIVLQFFKTFAGSSSLLGKNTNLRTIDPDERDLGSREKRGENQKDHKNNNIRVFYHIFRAAGAADLFRCPEPVIIVICKSPS
jgi:hypothetical protein